MMQRLVGAAEVVGRQKGRHGLDAFAFEGQQQALAIALQRLHAAGMPGGPRQAVQTGRKTFLLCAWRRSFVWHIFM